MRIIGPALLILLLPGVAPGFAAAPAGDAAVVAVEDLEHARHHAMVSVDVEALTRILADDIAYVHSTGLAQTRDELVGMLMRGDIQYVSFKVETIAYRSYGATVVGTGVQSIELTNAGKPFTSRSRYTVVYAPVDGVHRMVAYQSTAMPEIVLQEKVGDGKAP